MTIEFFYLPPGVDPRGPIEKAGWVSILKKVLAYKAARRAEERQLADVMADIWCPDRAPRL